MRGMQRPISRIFLRLVQFYVSAELSFDQHELLFHSFFVFGEPVLVFLRDSFPPNQLLL